MNIISLLDYGCVCMYELQTMSFPMSRAITYKFFKEFDILKIT